MSENENPEEVVTHARVRLLDMPAGAGTMALITIDNDRDHTRRAGPELPAPSARC